MNWTALAMAIGAAFAMLLLWSALGVIARRRTQRRVAQLVDDAKAGKLPKVEIEEAANGVISISDDGFTVARDDVQIGHICWDAVREIRAFKRDLLTIDMICWCFVVDGDARIVEVHEDMVGFRELGEAAGKWFGIDESDWWRDVAFPAFATNEIVIWSRESRDVAAPDSVS